MEQQWLPGMKEFVEDWYWSLDDGQRFIFALLVKADRGELPALDAAQATKRMHVR